MGDAVNSQVTDSVKHTNAAAVSNATALAVGLSSITMADTIGLVMHNAVTAQKGMQTITEAAVAQTCVLIIALGAAKNG